MGRDRSRPPLSRKQASYARAFTSHGCPSVCLQTVSSASGVNAWLVSAMCWPISPTASSREKSPSRNEAALTLNALPPATTACSAVDRMR